MARESDGLDTAQLALWLTRAQVAQRWGVSESTVARMVGAGELQEVSWGYRTRRISLAEVAAWERRHTQQD
jgi:excisionase family DNA binding protein